MKIWMWRPRLQTICLLNDGSNERMIGSMKLARLWKSGSGIQGGSWSDYGNLDLKARPNIDVNEREEQGHDRFQEAGQVMEIWIWRQGPQNCCVLNKGSD